MSARGETPTVDTDRGLTMEAFALPSEQDEQDELAAVGVDLTPASPADAIDAAASENLRRMLAVAADLERYEAARRREVMAIDARYARRTDPLRRRAAALEAEVQRLAAFADFGKQQSRAVGYGTYGRRAVPARLQVTDAAALLAWARAAAPHAVRQTIKEDVPQRAAAAYFDATGAIPDGCEHVPEHTTFYAKPERPDAADLP